MGSSTQQLDTGLVTNLHASAGQECHSATEVGILRALPEIQLRTGRAKLVGKVMDGSVIVLADVTILRLHHFAEIGVFDFLLLEANRRKEIGGGKYLLLAELANARFG